MTRLCERPGCSEPGAAAYGMRPEDLVFWLAPLDRWNENSSGVLCARHADAMVVPRAWTLDDRREPVPRLFRPPPVRRPAAPLSTTGSPAARPRRRTSDHPAEQLELDGPAAPIPSPEVAVESSADLATGRDTGSGHLPEPTPWMPTFDTDDDLDGLLEVRSPLLARAFRGAERSDGREVDGGENARAPHGRPTP